MLISFHSLVLNDQASMLPLKTIWDLSTISLCSVLIDSERIGNSIGSSLVTSKLKLLFFWYCRERSSRDGIWGRSCTWGCKVASPSLLLREERIRSETKYQIWPNEQRSRKLAARISERFYFNVSVNVFVVIIILELSNKPKSSYLLTRIIFLFLLKYNDGVLVRYLLKRQDITAVNMNRRLDIYLQPFIKPWS